MSDPSPDVVSFTLNGAARRCHVSPTTRLSAILRDHAGLSAAKIACGIGRCGACMVLVDGIAVNGCLVMSWQFDGAAVVTPEGLDVFPQARVLKQALAAENAFQCGYCAPGVVVTLTALLRAVARPDEAAIRDALDGNICRCTGYHSIVRGAIRAVQMLAVSPD